METSTKSVVSNEVETNRVNKRPSKVTTTNDQQSNNLTINQATQSISHTLDRLNAARERAHSNHLIRRSVQHSPHNSLTISNQLIKQSLNQSIVYYPPDNFSYVSEGICRSSFPDVKNFPFLSSIPINQIVYLCSEPYPDTHIQWIHDSNNQSNNQSITLHQFGLPTNKDPLLDVPVDKINAALAILLEQTLIYQSFNQSTNQTISPPHILVHCNKGKHRTGCLIGCFRRCHNWALSAIFDEYRRFARPKDRLVDQQFIEMFDTETAWKMARERFQKRLNNQLFNQTSKPSHNQSVTQTINPKSDPATNHSFVQTNRQLTGKSAQSDDRCKIIPVDQSIKQANNSSTQTSMDESKSNEQPINHSISQHNHVVISNEHG